MATAQEFVKIAQAEVGNGPSKYNTGGLPWFAIFVNWCLKQVGYSRQGTAAASSFADFGPQHKAGDGYTPKKGDLLLVNYSGSWASHVAIVGSYDGTQLYAVNGNGSGDKVTQGPRSYSAAITVIEMTWDGSSSGGSSDKVTYFTDTNEVIPIHPTLFTLSPLQIDGDFAVYINNRNVTASISPLNWQNTRQELAVKVELSAAKSDARFTALYQPKKGDIVRIFLPDEVFRGVIVSDDTGDRHASKFTAADAGWYLGRNEDTYQFNNMDSALAIKKICGDLGVPIVYLDENGLKDTYITGVYIDKTVADVLWAILKNAGGQWNFDFVPDGIRIYRIGTYETTPQLQTSANTMLRDSVKHRGPESRTSSIEDMYNAVKVVSDTNVLTTARNEDHYQKYGLLQKVVSIDPEKENAAVVTEEKLAELNVEKNTLGFEMPVQLSDYTRAGEILTVEGIRYVIETSSHTIKKGRHMVNVDLERIEVV